MAQQIIWERLTPTEAETLAALVESGREVYAAPILIEENHESRERQFEAMGISFADCKTWRIGSKKVIVHLTPADEATYRLLLNELRKEHREERRKKRCMIPGKLKPLVTCRDTNSCTLCPYGRSPEDREPNLVSWDGLQEDGWEAEEQDDCQLEGDTRMVEQLHAAWEYDEIRKHMAAENPVIPVIFEMKYRDGYSVAEISELTGVTPRIIYFHLDRAKKIGMKYLEETNYEQN